jgi:hypothetical protein
VNEEGVNWVHINIITHFLASCAPSFTRIVNDWAIDNNTVFDTKLGNFTVQQRKPDYFVNATQLLKITNHNWSHASSHKAVQTIISELEVILHLFPHIFYRKKIQ